MQNVGRRRDRVATLKKPQPRFLRRGDKSQRQRLVAAQISINARGQLRRRNLVADLKSFGSFAVGIAGLHGQLVSFHQQRLILELVRNPPTRGLHRAIVANSTCPVRRNSCTGQSIWRPTPNVPCLTVLVTQPPPRITGTCRANGLPAGSRSSALCAGRFPQSCPN